MSIAQAVDTAALQQAGPNTTYLSSITQPFQGDFLKEKLEAINVSSMEVGNAEKKKILALFGANVLFTGKRGRTAHPILKYIDEYYENKFLRQFRGLKVLVLLGATYAETRFFIINLPGVRVVAVIGTSETDDQDRLVVGSLEAKKDINAGKNLVTLGQAFLDFKNGHLNSFFCTPKNLISVKADMMFANNSIYHISMKELHDYMVAFQCPIAKATCILEPRLEHLDYVENDALEIAWTKNVQNSHGQTCVSMHYLHDSSNSYVHNQKLYMDLINIMYHQVTATSVIYSEIEENKATYMFMRFTLTQTSSLNTVRKRSMQEFSLIPYFDPVNYINTARMKIGWVDKAKYNQILAYAVSCENGNFEVLKIVTYARSIAFTVRVGDQEIQVQWDVGIVEMCEIIKFLLFHATALRLSMFQAHSKIAEFRKSFQGEMRVHGWFTKIWSQMVGWFEDELKATKIRDFIERFQRQPTTHLYELKPGQYSKLFETPMDPYPPEWAQYKIDSDSQLSISRGSAKLEEILIASNLDHAVQQTPCFCIGDGPGGFSKTLLIRGWDVHAQTLKSSIRFDQDLYDHENFHDISGETGDFLKENYEKLWGKFCLITSDICGDTDFSNKEKNTELICKTAEKALKLLHPNGAFIFKWFADYPRGKINKIIKHHEVKCMRLKNSHKTSFEIYVVVNKAKGANHLGNFVALCDRVVNQHKILLQKVLSTGAQKVIVNIPKIKTDDFLVTVRASFADLFTGFLDVPFPEFYEPIDVLQMLANDYDKIFPLICDLYEEVYYGFLYRRYHKFLMPNERYSIFKKNQCALFKTLAGYDKLAVSKDLAIRIFGLKTDLSMRPLLEKHDYRLIDAYVEVLNNAKLDPNYTDACIPELLLRINAQCSAANFSRRLELNTIGVCEVRLDPIQQFKTENNVFEVTTGETTDTLVLQEAPPPFVEYKMPDVTILKKQRIPEEIIRDRFEEYKSYIHKCAGLQGGKFVEIDKAADLKVTNLPVPYNCSIYHSTGCAGVGKTVAITLAFNPMHHAYVTNCRALKDDFQEKLAQKLKVNLKELDHCTSTLHNSYNKNWSNKKIIFYDEGLCAAVGGIFVLSAVFPKASIILVGDPYQPGYHRHEEGIALTNDHACKQILEYIDGPPYNPFTRRVPANGCAWLRANLGVPIWPHPENKRPDLLFTFTEFGDNEPYVSDIVIVPTSKTVAISDAKTVLTVASAQGSTFTKVNVLCQGSDVRMMNGLKDITLVAMSRATEQVNLVLEKVMLNELKFDTSVFKNLNALRGIVNTGETKEKEDKTVKRIVSTVNKLPDFTNFSAEALLNLLTPYVYNNTTQSFAVGLDFENCYPIGVRVDVISQNLKTARTFLSMTPTKFGKKWLSAARHQLLATVAHRRRVARESKLTRVHASEKDMISRVKKLLKESFSLEQPNKILSQCYADAYEVQKSKEWFKNKEFADMIPEPSAMHARLFLKTIIKVRTFDSASSAKFGQPILGWQKQLNSIWTVYIRAVWAVLQTSLRDNFLIVNGDFSKYQFLAQWLKDRIPEDVMAQMDDMPEYDATQQEETLKLERVFMKAVLSIDDDLIFNEYYKMRRGCKVLHEFMTFETDGEKNSGETGTFITNTMLLMMLFVGCYDPDQLYGAWFGGDDDIFWPKADFTPAPYKDANGKYIRSDPKVSTNQVGEFCSKLVGKGMVFYDPIKLAMKVLSRDFSSDPRDTDRTIKDWQIAVADLLTSIELFGYDAINLTAVHYNTTASHILDVYAYLKGFTHQTILDIKKVLFEWKTE